MLSSVMGVTPNASARAARKRTERGHKTADAAADAERMRAIAAFTARSMQTKSPRPFGAAVVDTESGKTLLRALNAVRQESDPSAHAEVRAIRLATKKLRKISLAGYTLYSTCEPCPMCMSAALWAGLDRVVYGATIEDATRHCNQILISAREVAARSDMTCVVEGPLERKACYALFTHPRMQKAFRSWPTSKLAGRKRS
jgi:tRNA(Arg) A34 adenosine deaminase TadA